MKIRSPRVRVGAWKPLAAGLRLSATLVVIPAVAAPPAPPPDLTRSNQVDRTLTYNLGPTGLRGWIHTRAASNLDSAQGRTTTASRQILVTHVGTNSPAAGVMQVDDVILGVGGRLFTNDARRSFARAIQEAEKTENRGELRLTRWRAGSIDEATLHLRVMGDYAATAPFGCAKSQRILDEACRVLAQEPLKPDLWGAVNGLALLATGRPEYLPKVRDLAKQIGPSTLKLEPRPGMVTWDWGYKNLFLCEYFLVSGDAEVLPAIGEYTRVLAQGQSAYGTYGHGLAELRPDGRLHGSIPPYGPVNAAGLPANLSIVLGRRCGVNDTEIHAAIARADGFFGYFVDKGAIPYGEHEPWPYHENNGKNSMAAVLFGVQEGCAREARFYARMATAGYANREYGHTGQGFSYLWGALGANAGGPEAASAFFREVSWHLDLARRCDGSFTYDGGEQYGPGRTHDDTYYGRSSYNGLSPTACHVLTYALPLRKLLITGRETPPEHRLTRAEVAESIAAGRFDLDRTRMTTGELVAAFSNWSPVVRGWAAEELAARPGAKDMAPALIAMTDSPDVHVRQAACETLGRLSCVEALPALVRQLAHEDRWLRYKAAEAVRKLQGAAKPALPDLLRVVAATAEPLEPVNWADPVQIAQGQLAEAIFAGPLSRELQSADPALLYPAIRAVARNPDGRARATLSDLLQQKLSKEDVMALGPDIVAAVRERGPADTMFGNEIRMAGLKALTKFHFREGMELAVHFTLTQGGHGSEGRTEVIMRELTSYGAAARPMIPKLRELITFFNEECRQGRYPAGALNQRRLDAVTTAITAIETTTTQPELLSLAGPAASPAR